METNSLAWIAFSYLKSRVKAIGSYCFFTLVFAVVFYLYSIPLDAVLYAFLLVTCLTAVFSIYDFYKYFGKHRELSVLKGQITANLVKMPPAADLLEADYQAVISFLSEEKARITSRADSKLTEMMDYYTLWAHQIKTPIAAMRVLLQSEQKEQSRELLLELFKIEQYVDMVLGYLRIENTASDLLLQNYDLAELVKQAVRKYAGIFIGKSITLAFREMNCTVLTDEKWLVFVLEQLLSNALKYTNSGTIAIYMDETKEKVLVIEDTGIGIREEDLPRVFEKGFTGYNGRMDKKATGIGLYLCKKVLNKLSHKITIASRVGVGTTVRIDFSTEKTGIE